MLIALPAVVGLFVFTIALWYFGFGGQKAVATGQRLARLGGGQENPVSAAAIGATLRKRTNVSFGGISFVSGNVAQKWTTQLERAGLTLNAKEYLTMRLTVSLLLGAVASILLPLGLFGMLASPVGFVGVGFWLKRRIGSRKRKMESQLVELLQMLASGLRAGFGLIQAMEQSAEQLAPPISIELRRTMRDMAMGASVEQALGALNDRIGSTDFDIVITAILIQRSVGGNLAEILDNVAHTMRERERIRGEIRTLTSQQRLTGYIIGGIPVGLFLIFNVISPEFTSLLYTESLGRLMLGAALVMELMGFFVISRIVNIEV